MVLTRFGSNRLRKRDKFGKAITAGIAGGTKVQLKVKMPEIGRKAFRPTIVVGNNITNGVLEPPSKMTSIVRPMRMLFNKIGAIVPILLILLLLFIIFLAPII